MGNSESSSQLPAGADGRRGVVVRGRESEEENDATPSSVAVRAAVMVGTAVARAVLMVFAGAVLLMVFAGAVLLMVFAGAVLLMVFAGAVLLMVFGAVLLMEFGARAVLMAFGAVLLMVLFGAWNSASSSRSEHPIKADRRRDIEEIFGGGQKSIAGRVDGPGLTVAEDRFHQLEKIYQKNASRTIKFMTYNVWNQERGELRGRIEAIGRLVEEHSPDVIFFQEVTPNIKRIFRTFGWWGDYNCSDSSVNATHSDSSENATERDFCVVLSKLPIEATSCISLKGRKLPICRLDVGMGRRLYVASGHLKSPNPPQMYCKMRKTQAEGVTNILDFYTSNVVFGGDMNWDEDIDGPFPLPKGWVDAWTHLKPNDVGWTYDTESNELLKGRELLQKRLDRFVCKLRDFTLKDIKIIGNGAKQPSDHYGLLLTICYE